MKVVGKSILLVASLFHVGEASALSLIDYINEDTTAKVFDYRTCVKDRIAQLRAYDPKLAARFTLRLQDAFRISDDSKSGGDGYAFFHGTAKSAITAAYDQSRPEILGTIQSEKVIDKGMSQLFPELLPFLKSVPFKIHLASQEKRSDDAK